jgi:hypothetical protein
LFGTISVSQAVHLDKLTNRYIIDSIDRDIDHQTSRYTDAANGNYKTNEEYAEEAKKIDPNNIYKPLYPFSTEEDTGTKYATSHRCFGDVCKEPKDTKYATRPDFKTKSLA